MRKWQLCLPLLIIPFLISIPDDLERMRAFRAAGGIFHVVLPFLLTLLLFKHGPLSKRIFYSGAVAFLIIALCEPLQILVGRHARYQDALIDLSGVLIAVCFVQWRAGFGRKWLTGMLIALLIFPWIMWSVPGFVTAQQAAKKRFPLLADFETETERALWDLNSPPVNSLLKYESTGDNTFISVIGSEEDYYPGVSAIGLPRDWSDYTSLNFKARATQGNVSLIVRLDDFQSRGDAVWCGKEFKVSDTWEEYSVDLKKISESVTARKFRMDDIDNLLFYMYITKGTRTVQLDDIRLK